MQGERDMSDLKRVPRRATRAPGAGALGAGGARQALQRLQDSRKAEQRIERADRDRSLPLAAAQQRLWFLDQWNPGSAAYNAPLALRLTGPLDPAVLGRALTGVVERHEILRTRYGSADGLPHQIVEDAALVRPVLTDLRELPEEEREKHVTELIAEGARRPFDLVTGPVLRAPLVRLADVEHVLVLNIHHIVSDGWSSRIAGELSELYAAERAGAPTRCRRWRSSRSTTPPGSDVGWRGRSGAAARLLARRLAGIGPTGVPHRPATAGSRPARARSGAPAARRAVRAHP